MQQLFVGFCEFFDSVVATDLTRFCKSNAYDHVTKEFIDVPRNVIRVAPDLSSPPRGRDNPREEAISLVKAIGLKCDVPIVIHCDEMQQWAVPISWKQKSAAEKVEFEDCLHFRMLCLCKVAEVLQTDRLRFVLSGTSTLLDEAIRPATSYKTINPSLPVFTKEHVRKILEFYLHIGWAPSNIDHIFEELSGIPRASHYFLREVRSMCLNRGKPKLKDLDGCVSSAYQHWSSSLTGADGGNIWVEIFFAFMFPSVVGGHLQLSPRVSLEIPFSMLPKPWQRFAEAGAFELRGKCGQMASLFAPSGFMMRYMRDKLKGVCVGLEVAFQVLCSATLQPSTLPGIVWQVVLAVELLLATSPLYLDVARCFGVEHKRSSGLCLSICPKIHGEQVRNFNGKVMVVQDRGTDRWVDIGFLMNLECVCFVEVKADKNVTRLIDACCDFFEKMQTLSREKNVVYCILFLSRYKFTDWENRFRKEPSATASQKARSKFLKATERNKALKEILSMCKERNSNLRFGIIEGEEHFSGCHLPVLASVDYTGSLDQIRNQLAVHPWVQGLEFLRGVKTVTK